VLLADEPTGARTVRAASRRDVENINLRTYGWAHRHIFGRSQEAVTSIRMLARRNRGRMPAPKPYRQVLLFEAEAGDDRLAKDHAARGWPAQFLDDGRRCDFVVLDADSNPVEHTIKIHDLTKRRAIKRRGASDLERASYRGIHAISAPDHRARRRPRGGALAITFGLHAHLRRHLFGDERAARAGSTRFCSSPRSL
jgi:hypothetical protein